MTKVFILVISLWGYNGTEWVYVGNQMALQQPMAKEECLDLAANWSKHELNTYFRFSIECIEQKEKES